MLKQGYLLSFLLTAQENDRTSDKYINPIETPRERETRGIDAFP